MCCAPSTMTRLLFATTMLLCLSQAVISLSVSGPIVKQQPVHEVGALSRRSALAFTFGSVMLSPMVASATADCMSDCLNNCKQVAPKDPAYCADNCKDYCDQDDRTDGLSGSVSSEGGEVGILGSGTVTKGKDKPPTVSIPGLDFTSKQGRKLIGY